MNIAIVTFTIDSASMNIRKQLLPSFSTIDLLFDNYSVLVKNETNTLYLLQTDRHCIEYNNLDEKIEKQLGIKLDLLIFATKHQSKSGIHSLSVHTNGNWGSADYGGSAGFLATCPVRFIADAYLLLKEKNNIGYEVIIECTHHGPDTEIPSAWIEIGSDESSWPREDAGKIIADVIMNILPNFSFDLEPDVPVAVGIGGLHHCPEFAKRIERKDAYISHVCPKYACDQLTEEVFRKAIIASVPKATMILFDWKGVVDKERIIPIVEKVATEEGLIIKKTKEF
jgi:D-aminoacyl-tRNA deacylase